MMFICRAKYRNFFSYGCFQVFYSQNWSEDTDQTVPKSNLIKAFIVCIVQALWLS